MKTSHVTAIAALLLAGGLTALWFALRDESDAEVEVETGAQASESSAASDLEAASPETRLAESPEVPVAREKIALTGEGSEAAASAGPGEIVHGRLRNKITGEALPDYLLDVGQPDHRHELLTTDAHGEFATTTKMAPGKLSVAFFDHSGNEPEAEAQLVDHADASAALDLSVESGPTYWLDLQPAHEIEGAEIEARLHYVGPGGALFSRPEPVRRGETTWVRFGPLNSDPEETRGDSIRVSSSDGYWRGGAKVQDVRGRVPGVVTIKLDPLAVLQVHVVDSSASPVDGANLHLDWKNSAGRASKAAGRSRTDGTFTFRYLDEGQGTLALRSVFHLPRDVPVRMVARETANAEVVLEKLPVAGAIRGRITSDTGTYAPKVGVALTLQAGPSSGGPGPAPLRTAVRWETLEGRKVGLFDFEGLPKGDYRIDLDHGEDFFSWEPRRLVLAPPSEAALFVVRDAVPNAGLAFRVRDGDNGLPLDGFRVSLEIQGRRAARILIAQSNQVLYEHVPLDRKITWRIDKDDYQPAFGDETSFVAREMRGDLEVRCAEIDLDPGWGEVFRVVYGRGNGERPIAGAHILLDGRDSGATAADGTVHVSAKRKPAGVQCAYKDWSVAGRIDLSPPRNRSSRDFVRIQMRPAPRKKSP